MYDRDIWENLEIPENQKKYDIEKVREIRTSREMHNFCKSHQPSGRRWFKQPDSSSTPSSSSRGGVYHYPYPLPRDLDRGVRKWLERPIGTWNFLFGIHGLRAIFEHHFGTILHRFWNHLGSQHGSKIEPKSLQEQHWTKSGQWAQ